MTGLAPAKRRLLKIVPPVDPENLTWEIAAALNNPFGEPDWAVLTITDDDEGGLWLGTDESCIAGKITVGSVLANRTARPKVEPVGDMLVRETWFGSLHGTMVSTVTIGLVGIV